MSTNKNVTLGKGLGSLIPNKRSGLVPDHDAIDSQVATQAVLNVPIGDIHSNPHQPRKHFSKDDLASLASSIRQYGVLQPLVVMETKSGYELVAGERRLRASKQAKLTHVPVIIRNADALEQFELALIENIQREDLSPIERADAYKKLLDEFGLTHEEAAKRLGVSRPSLSNTLRLLNLSGDIQKSLDEGKISEGQAKVLLELKSPSAQDQVFKKIVSEGLTVEETKSAVEKVRVKQHDRVVKKKSTILDIIAKKLQSLLGAKVSVKKKGSGGVVQIEYFSEEELKEIVEKMIGE